MKRRYNNNRGSAVVGILIIIIIIAVAAFLIFRVINKSKSVSDSNGYYTDGGKLYCYHDGKSSEIAGDFSGDTASVRFSSDGKYIFYISGTSLKVSAVDGKSTNEIAENADEFEIKSDGTEVIYKSGSTVYYAKISNGAPDGDPEKLAENCTDVVSLCGGDNSVSAYYVEERTENIKTKDYITGIPTLTLSNAQRTLINDLKTSTIDVTLYSLYYVTSDGEGQLIDDNMVYVNATNSATFRSASDTAAVVYQRAVSEPQVKFSSITGVNILDAEGEVKIAFSVPSEWYIATKSEVKKISSISANTSVAALSDDGTVLCYFDNYSSEYQYADLMRLDLVGSNQPTTVCSKVYTEGEVKFVGGDTPVYLMLEDTDDYRLGVGGEKRSASGSSVSDNSVAVGGNTAAFITTDGDLYIYTEGGESKAVKVDSSVSSVCCVTDDGSVIYKLGSGEIKIADNTGKNTEKIK